MGRAVVFGQEEQARIASLQKYVPGEEQGAVVERYDGADGALAIEGCRV
jgi:hypothetical protein